MRHLISLLLLVAALIAYMTGVGPLFFGVPFLGSILCAAGLVLEIAFWQRLIRSASR
jgi:hypothetical protein